MHYIKSQEQEINRKLYRHLLNGEFGIEKESLRVDAQGRLASTSHPKGLNAQISRDFSEGQVEFISGVYDNLKEACDEICNLQCMVEAAILDRREGAEYMWTYSNPPLYQTEQNIRIAEFEGYKEVKTTYREYLAEKYGKVKMLFSGVHLNYSMPREFFETLLEKVPGKTLAWLKSEWYVRLCSVLMSDSWLIVALTAASPVADETFLKGLFVPKEEWNDYASFRNSKYGYWNLFCPGLAYTDFASYLESVAGYVKRKEISSIQELYYPIRLKPAGENTYENLKENGVNHIELRMLDLNPMCCSGVARRDLVFIHLLIAYRSAEILKNWRDWKQDMADEERILLHQKAARFSFWEENKAYQKRAYDLIQDMKRFFRIYEKDRDVFLPEEYAVFDVLDFEEEKILNPNRRYANQLRQKYKDDYIGARMREILEW